MSARAADYPIQVACPAWRADAAAQVEARIRTTLLAEGLAARQVRIACTAGDAVDVAVDSEHGALVVPVVRRADRIEDDVVRTVEWALRQLIPPPPEPPPTETPAPEPPALPPPALPPPAPSSAPPSLKPAPLPRREPDAPTKLTELYVTPTAELWGDLGAIGAEAGIGVGTERFGYGLALNGRTALGEPSSFDVNEWGATVRISLTPRPFGFRLTLGLGASLLMTSPAASVVADSPTLLSALSLEAKVSRPFWSGPIALSPELGMRLFSARRNIVVDATEQAAVPIIVPQLALSVIYRY